MLINSQQNHIYNPFWDYGASPVNLELSEVVPSINYIGRQLDVSYIGREMYGEIVFCSNAFFHELSVSEYCPTINTYICDPYRRKKGKAYYEFGLNATNYLKHKKLYFDLIENS